MTRYGNPALSDISIYSINIKHKVYYDELNLFLLVNK